MAAAYTTTNPEKTGQYIIYEGKKYGVPDPQAWSPYSQLNAQTWGSHTSPYSLSPEAFGALEAGDFSTLPTAEALRQANESYFQNLARTSGMSYEGARGAEAGGSLGAGATGDWQNTLKQAQKLYSEAVAPYAQQVRAGTSSINDYYNQLLNRITGDVTNVKSAEYGKRGIPLSSGAYATDVQRTTAPYVESATQQKTQALQNILDLAAQIESGALTSGANAGLSIYGTQVGQQQSAAQLALQQQQLQAQIENNKAQLALAQQQATPDSGYMTLGEGQAVYDPATGQVLYKNPNTYKPSDTSGGGWE